MSPETKETLRNSLVGLLTSVVLIVLGYKLNDWMSRDRLTIEYIQFKPQTQGLPPKSEIAGQLLRNPGFTQWNGSSPFSPCTASLGDQVARTWNAPVVKQIKLCLQAFSEHIDHVILELRQARSSVQSVPDYGALIASIQSDLTPEMINALSAPGSDAEKRSTLQGQISSALNIDTEAQKISKEILGYLETYHIERTGELEIWITVLNHGDTDGLVRPEAFLTLNDPNIAPLRIRLAPSNEILSLAEAGVTSSARSIPKRSSATLVFRLLPQELDASTRSYVVRDVKQKPDLAASVDLRDIRNSPIKSKQFPFPAEDNESDADSR